ncbi:MAG: transporter substrate-binding domain-containing protein [Caenispirillum sp.]|nr:transporter substrate-binding domain-containing protein [Caenispirillum sp.]
MTRLFRFSAAAVVALLTSAGTADADTFRVGVEDLRYYPHYNYENGAWTGFGRDLLDAFAADAGHTFVYEAMPVKRLFQALVDKTVDFKYPDNAYWSADMKDGKGVTYSAPVVRYIDGVVVLPAKVGGGADGIATLGTVRGFTPFAWLARVQEGKTQLAENSDYDALLQQAMKGRVDGAYANVAVARWRLREVLKQPDALVFDPALPHADDFYHLSTTTRPEVVAQFDAWMAANPSKVEALKVKYGLTGG